MIDFDFTSLVFAAGLAAGVTLNVLLLRTLLAPPFRIWPTPEPGSWQSLTFWSLFRGGMIATFVVAVLDWNSTPLLDWTRFIPGLPLGLIGLFITVCGYFNLGLGNTYCGADGLVTGGLYRFSRNPQYTASIVGLVGLSIGANSIAHHCPVHGDGGCIRHDGAGRGGLAQAALRRALSRLLPANCALPRRPRPHRSRRTEKAATRAELS